ncbi:MAG: 5'/3'-nucleotidase SurE [Dysgonamonadaceae bacterium]|jgi:5'-nucleotidase|nr:5'/3'-nucleotidase SurE [Dysgonamonadaceae bacterium]
MTDSKKPLILITNDDGVHALGINRLIEAIAPLGEVVVVAPDGPRSGMSSAITSMNPIRVSLLKDEKDLKIYACTGTPVDCVKIGIDRLLGRKPDLLVSGINHGSNAAVAVIYSGTVGAALEGCIIGVPSLAVSLTNYSHHADFSEAAKFGKSVAEKVLKEGLPKGICLNLNVPDIPKVKGLKVGSQTAGRWTKEFEEMKDPSGKSVYWLTGEFFNEEPGNENNDEWALANGYAALVPLHIDMTAYHFIEKIRNWEE